MPDADVEILLWFIPTLPETECQGSAATSAKGRRCNPLMSIASSLTLLLGSGLPPHRATHYLWMRVFLEQNKRRILTSLSEPS